MDKPTPLDRAPLLPLLGNSAMNGHFVVAVRTTKIYCLPGCRPPRPPKPENVDFYASPADARSAGFRACKLCRPDAWVGD